MSQVANEDVQNVISGLLDALTKDQDVQLEKFSEYPAIKQAFNDLKDGDLESYHFLFVYPIENLFHALARAAYPQSDEAQFLVEHSQFVENHYEFLIKKFEGWPCCADKSRTLIRSLLYHFTTGKEIVFDYTQEYTYHLPSKLFKTHEDIISFYKGIVRLFYGDPELHMTNLAKIYQEQQPV